MSDKRCSPTAAHSSSSIRAFKSPTQTHLNHSVWEQSECLWYEKHVHVESDESILRVRNYVPSITEQNIALKGTFRRRTGDGLVSDGDTPAGTHKCSRNRHLMSLCPTALSFFPSYLPSCSQTGSACASLMFADRQCLCFPHVRRRAVPVLASCSQTGSACACLMFADRQCLCLPHVRRQAVSVIT
jgi:hypothetical protein